MAGLVLCVIALSACTGDFDQRQEKAKTQGFGASSIGTAANPENSRYIRGAVSTAGSVRDANVILRPILDDGSVDLDDNNVLGNTVTFSNGIYQAYLTNPAYRGPILVEVSGGAGVTGANPATALSNRFHDMLGGHKLYSVVPNYEGYNIVDVNVTPLTSVAVGRCLSFDGSIAGVVGGISTGMFGLCCQQVAEFFGIDGVRALMPKDFSASGSFGSGDAYAYVLAALSQVAKDIGVTNAFDFWQGLYEDALDDGELNGSISIVPNTPISMPDLTAAGLIGSALFNNYMDPNNLERKGGVDNTNVTAGSALDVLITTLDTSRDINAVVRTYDLILQVPLSLNMVRGQIHESRIQALDQLGTTIHFNPYGDSGGPSFVEFAWSSSSPANVSIQQFGRITVDAAATKGKYTLTLTVQPLAGQTFVNGPTKTFSITVNVQ
ncbi:MAG: hypothetical protein H6839_06365 [Planctomycetes bacterium]|nr:hypothetical protein [Planctomycetota bacterium]